MTQEQAIAKMQKVEKIFDSLKKSGFDVRLVDNDKIVLESPNTIKRNSAEFEKADKRYERNGLLAGGDRLCFDAFTQDVKYDYEIFMS